MKILNDWMMKDSSEAEDVYSAKVYIGGESYILEEYQGGLKISMEDGSMSPMKVTPRSGNVVVLNSDSKS